LGKKLIKTSSKRIAGLGHAPVIVALQEADWSIAVPEQPGKKVHKTLSQQKKLDLVVYTCYFSYSGKHKTGGSWFRSTQAGNKTLSQK
jgi:hypothetical protein